MEVSDLAKVIERSNDKTKIIISRYVDIQITKVLAIRVSSISSIIVKILSICASVLIFIM